MRKFVRTRAAPQPQPLPHALPIAPHTPHAPHAPHAAHKTNGHANGVGTAGAGGAGGARREDHHSTLSRYRGGSEGSGGPQGGCGALWEDPEFPAHARSLADRRHAADVVWMRPHEVCAHPRFLGDESLEAPDATSAAADPAGLEPDPEPDEHFAARWYLEPGEVGDANLCCAAAALALTPRLLARVAPPHSFRTRYSGAFRFRFWVFGVWREVAVDDRLPWRGARVLHSRSALPHDFTVPLLEKAYAKLHGSYAALRAGSVARALQELSGGVVQSFAPPLQPRALLYRVLNSAVPRSTLLVATLPLAPADKQSVGRRLRNGLIPGTAYCVTGLARVRDADGAEGGQGGEGEGAGGLVRVRAVGGRGQWAGAWARGSREWRALPPPDRDLLARRADRPGDFWMSFADFARAFPRLELVHVGPDDWLREPALHARRPWRAVLARRRWRAGYNAGGPPGAPTAHANPHFHVSVPPPAALAAPPALAAPAAPPAPAAKCHVVVSVTQQYAVGAHAERELRGVGFAVYELPPGATPRRAALSTAPADLRTLDVTHESRAREVVTFFTLPPGQYLVVPHTRRAHAEAAFLLRILTDDHTDVWEVNDDNVIIRDIAAEFVDERELPPRVRTAIDKLVRKRNIEEVDARLLRAVVSAGGVWGGGDWRDWRDWRGCGPCARRPPLELCRALVMLRDAALAGAMPAHALPPLLALLACWQHVFSRGGGRGGGGGSVSSYRLRALLWACGVSASNKVLECLVLRFARRARLSADAYVMALARLHLAHERYRSLDAKVKSNPLSLEEMILMTIYS